ncbi:MAG: hypothetical protein IKS15_02615 [Opitutales bacterium]|nr:hypothetical protein [Opitutales bacterium]
MKTLISLILLAGALLFAACSSTKITETAYAEDGKTVLSVKETETSESPLVIGLSNTREKHLVAHIGGWYVNLGVQPNSNSYGIGAGTIDNTYASLVSGTDKGGELVVPYFPAIVDASKYSLTVNKEGLKAGNETDKAATDATTEKE